MSTAIGLGKSVTIGRDVRPQAIAREPQSPVFIIFTSLNQTRKALEKASQLAGERKCGIEILAIQIVPFIQPLDEPSIPFEFMVHRLEEMANQMPERTRISAYLCREPMEALNRALKPDCTVVIGFRRSWWPTREERLARKLLRAGYTVIPVETE